MIITVPYVKYGIFFIVKHKVPGTRKQSLIASAGGVLMRGVLLLLVKRLIMLLIKICR